MKEVKHISELFVNKDIRGAADDGYRQRRNYETPSGLQLPKAARFKMQVYFIDGNKRYFYSFDYHKPVHDEWVGLAALIAQRVEWQDKIKTVSIYANLDRVPLTKDKKYDVLVFRSWVNKAGRVQTKENPNLGFEVIDNRTILKLKTPLD